VFLYGVVNASPDSLNLDSIATSPEAAVARARQLLADGADGIDLGGQGSTDNATVVPWQAEWDRLRDIVPALAELDVPMSIDSWRPEVTRRALAAGATVINAADGMQSDDMWAVAAEFDVPIVVPFLSGPNPR
jgi:dihydropteroate synthase